MADLDDSVAAEIEALQQIEAEGFCAQTKATATMICTSLIYLQRLSKKLGLPIDDITVAHILEDTRPADKQFREMLGSGDDSQRKRTR